MAENLNADKVSADLDQIRTLVHSANQSIQDQTVSAIDTIENRFTKFADSCDVLIQSLKLEMGELGQSFEKASGQLDKLKPQKLTEVNVEAKQSKESVKDVSEAVKNVDKNLDKIDASGLDQVTKKAEDAGKALEKAGKKSGGFDAGKAKESISSMAEEVGGIDLGGISDTIGTLSSGLGGVANLAVDAAAKSISLATDMSDAMGNFAVKTGVSQESLDGYQEVLESIYSGGYGESFADISDAMVNVKQSFGDLSDEQLQGMTESALALRDAFGYDVSESTEAAKALMEEFGVSGEEAFNMIAKGSQDGLLASGEMLEGIEASHESFALMAEDASGTAEAMTNLKDIEYGDMGSMLEEMGRSLEMVLLPIGEALLPVLSTLLEAIQPLLDAVLALIQPILDLITGAIGPLMDVLNPLIEIISTGLTEAINFFSGIVSDVFSGVLDSVTKVLDNFRNIIGSVIDFVKNVFSGNWKGAWDSVKNIFSNIWDSIKEVVKIPINYIIDAINGLIRGLNKIKIPDWSPVFPGRGLNIKEIPRLKVGIDYVPSDFYPAYLDRGERVLTAEENARFAAAGGFAALESRGAYMMFDPSLIAAAVRLGLENANICVRGDVHTTLNADGKQLGEVVTPYVNQGLGALADGKERGR